ncbi:hypothetical protein OZX74_01665 [Bifidobacterium sp. ESL0798]|uniref:hypothetical protein n=1 Tax=Bifidobacterium sp. ESL0798 TaxID=2983235 RepID=UPI0023F8C646|nr:hypothetical protein [Bifidobacterium sp. ESL0798]WEV74291.1 hypothetical protein OZX74_01665 [Bifidobacterium sp. ESL0798]
MNKSEQTTMVANFDSMEQLKQWMRIAEDLKISANGVPKAKKSSRAPSLADGLWVQSDVKNNCESLLNTYPQFASCFAGIIRTAYLYAPKIVVTVADLFDGVFFVALGPKAVNGILGTSYKDGAKLVVSGWEDTLEKNLISFILDKDRQKINKKTYCTLDGRLLGIDKLERAFLGRGTHLESMAFEDLSHREEHRLKAFEPEPAQSGEQALGEHWLGCLWKRCIGSVSTSCLGAGYRRKNWMSSLRAARRCSGPSFWRDAGRNGLMPKNAERSYITSRMALCLTKNFGMWRKLPKAWFPALFCKEVLPEARWIGTLGENRKMSKRLLKKSTRLILPSAR